MCFSFHRTVICKMFKCLTHFDALGGFDGNTYCLLIRVGRSQNLVGVSALWFSASYIAKYSLTNVFYKVSEVRIL